MRARRFRAGSTRNEYSVALGIVESHIPPETTIKPLAFPMTENREELRASWRANAEEVLAELNRGRDAAFITLGDPLVYSTFGYLLKTIRSLDPDVRIETVPGITAYQAAAARLNVPLVEGREALTIIPGTLGKDRIRDLAGLAGNAAILKAYRNYDQICLALDELDAADRTWLVSHCGLKDELIQQGLRRSNGWKPPYLSLLIVKNNGAADED